MARGQLDEALRIRREELPVYEKLGARRDLLVGRTNLAIQLRKRGSAEDLQEAHLLLQRALHDAQQLGLPEASAVKSWLDRTSSELAATTSDPPKRLGPDGALPPAEDVRQSPRAPVRLAPER